MSWIDEVAKEHKERGEQMHRNIMKQIMFADRYGSSGKLVTYVDDALVRRAYYMPNYKLLLL